MLRLERGGVKQLDPRGSSRVTESRTQRGSPLLHEGSVYVGYYAEVIEDAGVAANSFGPHAPRRNGSQCQLP